MIRVLWDVDECLESREVCMEGRCRNTVGSFVCACEDGFSVQNGMCTGIRTTSAATTVIIISAK